MTTYLLALLLVAHGAVHWLGFAKAFGLAQVPALGAVPRTQGVAWLLAGVLLFISAVLLFLAPTWWWPVAGLGVVLSQALILSAWQEAKFGTIPNLLIALPVLVASLKERPSSFRSRFRAEVAALARATSPPPVEEADLAHLPDAVRAYLRFAGVVGRPRVLNFHARFNGQIRAKPDGPWMPFRAEQLNTFEPLARLFYIESSLYGFLPFDGLHRYVGSAATMQIKALSAFTVADAKGPQMNQSETVTLFNDSCVLAPATLIDRRIRWEPIDLLSVRATFANAGQVIAAVLYFDRAGRLVNFCSEDRFLSADGASYSRYRWCTPLRDYREFAGARVAARGEPSWALPSGELVYGRFELLDLRYNVGSGALQEDPKRGS